LACFGTRGFVDHELREFDRLINRICRRHVDTSLKKGAESLERHQR
jgi:hypothetical protein